MRRLIPGSRPDERGAIVVIVAAFSVVLVTMAALVVDVGSILDEKRQLQNGADAAALGVAQLIGQTCPTGPCTAATLTTTARDLAQENARDRATTIDGVTTDFVRQRVTVTTSTRTPAGGTILPYWFGQTVTHTPGRSVAASAVASWSGLRRASVIPLALSKCEFTRATSGGTVFNVATVVLFHTRAATCTSTNGLDVPGGFGWLADENDSNTTDCNVTPTIEDSVRDDSGLPGTPHACDLSTLLDTDILLPIYDALVGSGSNGRYHIYGFAMLHMTGYRFTPSQTRGTGLCSTPDTCVSGQFVRFVAAGEYGGPNLGNRVALLS
jgi:hypothetical protein